MEIMGAMKIAMIESRMRMRSTILEENMRKMLNTTLMVKIARKKALVVVPMMMPEHVTLPTPRVKYEEHVPKACEDSYSYSCANLYPS
ncbi:hypothetical protein H5410_014766 [Solanum commersonii]|uniref:Uncharacterized protein n=1 Tax=Solanum commersonii TaxID=4109 RepID=A0A9J5ZRV7_SOLCO|nr:hypothetical protein H5410_014766 [Solanum commersonii]